MPHARKLHKPTDPMDNIQRRSIFAMYKQLGYANDADMRHLIQQEVAGKESLTKFTRADALKLISHLNSYHAKRHNPNTVTSAPPAAHTSPFLSGGSSYPARPLKSINEEQQKVIKQLYAFLDYDLTAQRSFTKRIVKKPWAQTAGDGKAMVLALFTQAIPSIIEIVTTEEFRDKLTDWERTYFFTGAKGRRATHPPAMGELLRFNENRNKRGSRTLPAIALSKLFEIIEKRG